MIKRFENPDRRRRIHRLWAGSVAWIAAGLALTGCGAGLLSRDCAEGYVQQGTQCVAQVDPGSGGSAGAGGGQTASVCAVNADCSVNDVCVSGQCQPAGECVFDGHCSCAAPTCVDRTCTGANVCATGGAGGPAPVYKCVISADCAPKFYCISGVCQFATECTKHAECPPNEGCFHSACWPI